MGLHVDVIHSVVIVIAIFCLVLLIDAFFPVCRLVSARAGCGFTVYFFVHIEPVEDFCGRKLWVIGLKDV